MKILIKEYLARPLKIKKIKNSYIYSLIMKLSFWKNKPLQVNNDSDNDKECTQILSNNELLNKMWDDRVFLNFDLIY